MNALLKFLIVMVIAAAVAFGIYQSTRASRLKAEVANLQQKNEENLALSNKVHTLEREHAATVTPAAAPATSAATSAPAKTPTEVLRLRGEVGKLRVEKDALAATNAISKLTANPEARKMMRNQQKMGMTFLYKGLAQRAKLNTEQSEKLNEVLADYIMENVDRVTSVLRDKSSPEELNSVFTAQENALEDKVKELLGEDGAKQFKEYNSGLLATITAEQFKGMISGDERDKQAKMEQFAKVLREETQTALANAGLPADWQAIPILNFRNIASEQEAERGIKLMDDIYQRAAARSTDFLTAEDLKKFEQFRNLGISNSKGALMMNRTLMAPISQ